MHIAYLSTEFPHNNLPAAGGIGSFIKNLSKELINLGHQVTVFIINSNKNAEWKTEDEITIVEIKKKNSSIGALFYRLYISKIIKTYIKNNAIDIIECPDWEGYHAFFKLDVPLVTRIHGSVTYFNNLENKKKSKIIYFFEKLALRKSNKIIAVSKFSGMKTKQVFGFKNFDFEVIYNGIDTTRFNPIEGINENHSILYFGTLARKKGVLELPYIFNYLNTINKEVKLILIGKDSVDFNEQRSTWELMQDAFTSDALKNVEYKGAISYQEMNVEIAKSTICIFPSFAEAFPISWLEAMAMKKAIVASNIGWASEALIENESAFLVSPQAHNEFALKINTLLTQKELRAKFEIAARERVLCFFDNKNLIINNLEFYNSLVRC